MGGWQEVVELEQREQKGVSGHTHKYVRSVDFPGIIIEHDSFTTTQKREGVRIELPAVGCVARKQHPKISAWRLLGALTIRADSIVSIIVRLHERLTA